jgi:hypothetical protein
MASIDSIIADSILDRLVHNAFRIELGGESMLKKRGKKRDESCPSQKVRFGRDSSSRRTEAMSKWSGCGTSRVDEAAMSTVLPNEISRLSSNAIDSARNTVLANLPEIKSNR